MEKVKIKLLKRHYRNDVGDVIEVRPMEARALIAVGVAEEYVPRRGRTTTREMQPEQNPTSTETMTAPTIENTGTGSQPGVETSGSPSEENSGFGRTPYSRRDMKPEE